MTIAEEIVRCQCGVTYCVGADAYVVAPTNREPLRISGRAGRRLRLYPIHVHCAVRVAYPVNQHGWHVINVLYNY
jgi:hypothetical protein